MAAGHEGVLEAIFNPTSAIYSSSETDIEVRILCCMVTGYCLLNYGGERNGS